MVDPISLRLALSATEVRELTGWPDAMVEDYIQILTDLVDIINDLNNNTVNITQLFTDYDNINSDLSGVRSIAAQTRAKVNTIKQVADDIKTLFDGLDQRLADASLGRIRAKLAEFQRDTKRWFPAKTHLTIEGAGVANPLVTNAYNIASATRTAPGVYQVTIAQDSYFAIPVLASTVFSLSKIIAPLSSAFDVEVITTSATTFEIRVYELTVLVAAVQRTAYDLQAGDFVSAIGILSINQGLPPR